MLVISHTQKLYIKVSRPKVSLKLYSKTAAGECVCLCPPCRHLCLLPVSCCFLLQSPSRCCCCEARSPFPTTLPLFFFRFGPHWQGHPPTHTQRHTHTHSCLCGAFMLTSTHFPVSLILIYYIALKP